MKKLLYTLATLVIITSCRSIDKMVERGDYDGAIHFATKKLAGKKNKKTKHVQGLEEAFARINERDLNTIQALDGNNHPQNWERIEGLSDQISRRQNRIQPFLPLISKEGYVANFDFVDTRHIKTIAQKGAAEFYYNEAVTLLDESRQNGEKLIARNAYGLFEKVHSKIHGYKNTRALMAEAKRLGIVNIQIEVQNMTQGYLPFGAEQELKAMNVDNMSSFWRKFYKTKRNDIEMDHLAILEISEIDLSPEREFINHHRDEKRVKDGFRYLKGKNGEILTDTTGKKLKEDIFKVVYADVSIIQREKAAFIKGVMKVTDNKSNAILSIEPLSVEVVFLDRASSFRGDRRAVCDKDHSYLKEYPLPFPDDMDMITDATYKLKGSFIEALNYVSL